AAFALAAAGLWLSDSVSEVAVVRVLQAVGPAAFISASSALAVDLSPPDMRATGLGLAGAFKSLGAAVGPPVAIALAGSSGFAAVFFVCFIVGAVGVAVSVLLQEDRSPVRDPAAAAPADRRPVRGLGPWREVLDPYWSRFAALSVAGVSGGLAGGRLSERLGGVTALFHRFLVDSAGVVRLTALPSVVLGMRSAVLA